MSKEKEQVYSPFRAGVKKFFKNPFSVTGLVVLVVLVLFAVIGPMVTGYDQETMDMMNMLKAPTAQHLLGTDDLGRDILTRLACGGRVSISVGIFATMFKLVIGVLLGSIAGLYGGVVDSVIMRITDIIMCFPFFVISLSIAAITGPSFKNVIFIIGILGWPSVCRIVRSKVLQLKNMEYVEAAQALGLGAVWLGTWPRADAFLGQKTLFDLPEHILPHSILALGWPEGDLTAPRPDRYEEEKVHWEKW